MSRTFWQSLLIPFALLLFSSGISAGESLQLPVLDWEVRSDWIDIKTLGAVGDGKTDDTDSVQKALAMIVAPRPSGISIYFPAGTYRITRTLKVTADQRPVNGVLLVGRGRESRLLWDGCAGGTLLEMEGMAYSRMVGIEFDGAGKAAIGHRHISMHTFETAVRNSYLAFRNFTQAGVYADPNDKFAMAETHFDNCLFERNGIGVSFTKFNDYDITFSGCDFRRNDIGILCQHGHYYVRNTHFEESRNADIVSQPEHNSSVRRSTSLNSRMFIRQQNLIAGLVIEGCSVSGWRNPDGAISLSGAPVTMFDTHFTNPPKEAQIVVATGGLKRLVASENTALAADNKPLPLFAPEFARSPNLCLLPAGKRKGIRLDPAQVFFQPQMLIPGKVFDARRDFGAVGDGRTNDTEALQKTIDAARAHGKNAIAYVPSGKYVVKNSLTVTGQDYTFGGAGLVSTQLIWTGDPEGTTIRVEQAQNVTVENLLTERPSGLSILHRDTGAPSSVCYKGVFMGRTFVDSKPAPARVSVKSPPASLQDDLEIDDLLMERESETEEVLAIYGGGMRLENLSAKTTVILDNVLGHLDILDSADAVIFAPVTYYGQLRVRGKSPKRGGFLGFQTRFSGVKVDGTVEALDNHSIILSDYYTEGSKTWLRLSGHDGEPAGRVTVQGAKIQPEAMYNMVESTNYAGTLFLGSNQPYMFVGKFTVSGHRPLEVILCGMSFYGAMLQPIMTGDAKIYMYGNAQHKTYPNNWTGPKIPTALSLANNLPVDKSSIATSGLDHLRELGEYDLQLLFPHVHAASK